MEKFDIQVDENTRNQATLLHDDIPGYDLPTIDFVQTTTDQDEDVCMTFALCIYAIYIMVQHESCILLISTNFDLLTNYSSLIIILLQTERNILINDSNSLTKHISL